MRLRGMLSVATLLSALSALCAIALLLLSGWFISATALAAVGGTALTFNYLLPSAAIRLLAFLRILAGYGEKYFGHDQLLSDLNRLREKVFRVVMHSGTGNPRAMEMERIENGTNALANSQLAVFNPVVSGVVVFSLICTGLVFWVAAQAQYMILTGIAFVLLCLLLFYLLLRELLHYRALTAQYRAVLAYTLEASPLWSLSNPFRHLKKQQAAWSREGLRIKRLEMAGEWLLLATCLSVLLLVLVAAPNELLGSPLFVLLPLVLLAAPEWLGPVLRTSKPAADALLAKKDLQQYRFDAQALEPKTESDNKRLPAIARARLSDFAWQREKIHGLALSVQFSTGQIIHINGDSGNGKSSLLLALCGQIPALGDLAFYGGEGNSITIDEAQGKIFYSEQQPSVLAASLAHNLRVADPDAGEDELLQALDFACLSYLKPKLDEWLGEQGRLLSGGERKRLAIARAYLSKADMWLLDEPFEGLDKQTKKAISQSIFQAAANKIICIASHQQPSGFSCDKTIDLHSEPHRKN